METECMHYGTVQCQKIIGKHANTERAFGNFPAIQKFWQVWIRGEFSGFPSGRWPGYSFQAKISPYYLLFVHPSE